MDIDVVIKIGGGLLTAGELVDRVLGSVAQLRTTVRLLVVPGGGPFADSVRAMDAQFGLDADVAHWMAILGMDQYAHFLASRMPSGTLVEELADAYRAVSAGQVPVLAPFKWLRDRDPLVHSWDVTSDSIAAWIAGAVGAKRLVLIKPPGASGRRVDSHFERALPNTVTPMCVPADSVDTAFAGL